MKTTNLILILIVVLSFLGCKEKGVQKSTDPELPVTKHSNQMHVVTLYVNTAEIDQSTIDKHANFNQPRGIANRDFTTYVRKGDLVIWNAVFIGDSLEEYSSHKVDITAIIDQPGADDRNKKYINFFDRDTLIPDPKKPNRGIVVRTIRNGEPGDAQKYMLKFIVNGKKDTLKIDPKMEMY